MAQTLLTQPLFINKEMSFLTFDITKHFIILDLALRMTHTKNISDFKVPHSSTVNIWTRSTFHHCNGHTKAYLQLTSFILECNSTINRILGLNIAGIVNAVLCHSQLLVRQQWLLRNQGFNCLKWQQLPTPVPVVGGGSVAFGEWLFILETFHAFDVIVLILILLIITVIVIPFIFVLEKECRQNVCVVWSSWPKKGPKQSKKFRHLVLLRNQFIEGADTSDSMSFRVIINKEISILTCDIKKYFIIYHVSDGPIMKAH